MKARAVGRLRSRQALATGLRRIQKTLTTPLFRRPVMVLCLPLLLTGCLEGRSIAFAPSNSDTPSHEWGKERNLTAVFGEGKLVLAAPSGFCFDAQLETHTATGGFALMAPCDRLSTFGRLRSNEGAMLTATIGRVAPDTPPPSAAALHKAFTANRTSARVLETRTDAEIPLVKLFSDGQPTAGASGTHWRGVFVLHGHLVSVALFAPDGSRYLGDKGARLIQDFMRATRNATQLAEISAPESSSAAPQHNDLRPKPRPAARDT